MEKLRLLGRGSMSPPLPPLLRRPLLLMASKLRRRRGSASDCTGTTLYLLAHRHGTRQAACRAQQNSVHVQHRRHLQAA